MEHQVTTHPREPKPALVHYTCIFRGETDRSPDELAASIRKFEEAQPGDLMLSKIGRLNSPDEGYFLSVITRGEPQDVGPIVAEIFGVEPNSPGITVGDANLSLPMGRASEATAVPPYVLEFVTDIRGKLVDLLSYDPWKSIDELSERDVQWLTFHETLLDLLLAARLTRETWAQTDFTTDLKPLLLTCTLVRDAYEHLRDFIRTSGYLAHLEGALDRSHRY